MGRFHPMLVPLARTRPRAILRDKRGQMVSTPREFFLLDNVELSVDRDRFDYPAMITMRVGLYDDTADAHRCSVVGSLDPGQLGELIRELTLIRDRLTVQQTCSLSVWMKAISRRCFYEAKRTER